MNASMGKNPTSVGLPTFASTPWHKRHMRQTGKGPRTGLNLSDCQSTCNTLQHLHFSWIKPHQYFRVCFWNWLKSTADVAGPELQITLPDRHVGSAFWQQCRKLVIIFVIKRNADGIWLEYFYQVLAYSPSNLAARNNHIPTALKNNLFILSQVTFCPLKKFIQGLHNRYS